MSKKYPPIELGAAKKLTKNWRTYYADLLRAYKNRDPKKEVVIEVTPNDPDIFRGFKIPLKDLKSILKAAKQYNKGREKDEKINAVRAYLAMGEPDHSNDQSPVHILLLPVAGSKDKPSSPALKAAVKDQDLFIVQEQSTIYDFTTPCPDMCDIESPLYKS